MSCDCYKIGGPWATYDPSCPAHGDEAQRERKEQEEREAKLEQEKATLEEAIRLQTAALKEMSQCLAKMTDLITNLDFRLNALEKKVARGFIGTTRLR